MHPLSKRLLAALLGVTLLSSCSRPVAYFQPTAREQFKATQPATVASVVPTQNQVAEVTAPAASEPLPTTTEQVTQTRQAVDQVEAYVRNDSKLASNKKLTKRIERLNKLLTSTNNVTVAPNAASAQKTTLMQRMMLKKIDKKIKNHVAPDETKAMTSNVRLGLIIGIVGLLLLILSNGGVLAVIGGLGLIVGLVLILIDLLGAA